MRKWRPRLSAIIVAMLGIALAMPLAGLFFFRLQENLLIRQTESELIAQSAVVAAVFAEQVMVADVPDGDLGAVAPVWDQTQERYHPVVAKLDLAVDEIGPRREPALAPAKPETPQFAAIGARLEPLLAATQQTTLAGFRITDPNGVVIAGKDENGLSLAGVPEVKLALAGLAQTSLRQRVSDQPPPPAYSLSRGTAVRVFVALPVIVRGRVAGVVLASRTPSNIIRELYEERTKLIMALLAVVTGAGLLGFLVTRTLTGPIRELTARSRRIADGDRSAIGPLKHNGTREMAELSDGLLAMARRLSDRNEQMAVFANHVSHELKSPLTSIQGAAELLRDETMTGEEQTKFLANIIVDTQRLTLLVNRLNELARARGQTPDGAQATLATAAEQLDERLRTIVTLNDEAVATCLAVSSANLAAILGNLAGNAVAHGATRVDVLLSRSDDVAGILVSDNGSGISDANAIRIFDPFFTTRRDEGGTGMGLGIVKALAEAHGGTIEHVSNAVGACFKLTLPVART